MNDEIQPGVDGISEIESNPEPRGMVCPKCKSEYRPGFTTCSDCRIDLVSELPVFATEPEDTITFPLDGLTCQQHPGVDVVARCSACSSGVCNTCDFQVSSLHFCPQCIENASDEKINPRRKRLAVWAVIIASYCTLGGIMTFSGLLYLMMGTLGEPLWGMFIMYGLYIPSAIGTAIAFSAFERNLKNPPLIRTALIWNSTILAMLIILEIVGRVTS